MSAASLLVLLMAACLAGLLWGLARQRRAHRAALAQAERMGRVLLTMARANRLVLRIDDERAGTEAPRSAEGSGQPQRPVEGRRQVG